MNEQLIWIFTSPGWTISKKCAARLSASASGRNVSIGGKVATKSGSFPAFPEVPGLVWCFEKRDWAFWATNRCSKSLFPRSSKRKSRLRLWYALKAKIIKWQAITTHYWVITGSRRSWGRHFWEFLGFPGESWPAVGRGSWAIWWWTLDSWSTLW